MRALIFGFVLCLLLGACGGGKKATSLTSSPSPTVAVSSTPAGTLTVVPASAALGAVFTFKVAGFQAGESVRFTVKRPSGKTFTGPPHAVTAAGTSSATYKPTESGQFSVAAAGSKGDSANATFVVEPPVARKTVVRPATRPAATPAPTPRRTAAPMHTPAPTPTYRY